MPDQMWQNRLSARTPIAGLYLCGAATHPAGSVIASQRPQRRHGSAGRCRDGVVSRGTDTAPVDPSSLHAVLRPPPLARTLPGAAYGSPERWH